MFAPVSNSSSINYSSLPFNPSWFVPFIGKVRFKKYSYYYYYYCYLQEYDVSFDNERFGSDPIHFPPDQTFNCCLKFEFERGVFICCLFIFFKDSSLLKYPGIASQQQLGFFFATGTNSCGNRNRKKKIQNLQGTYAVSSMLLYLFPPRPGPCSWTESHLRPTPNHYVNRSPELERIWSAYFCACICIMALVLEH